MLHKTCRLTLLCANTLHAKASQPASISPLSISPHPTLCLALALAGSSTRSVTLDLTQSQCTHCTSNATITIHQHAGRVHARRGRAKLALPAILGIRNAGAQFCACWENANDCAHAVAHRNSRITRKHYQRCMRTQTLEDARNSLQTFALQIYILRRGCGSCCARTCTKTQTSNIFPHSHQCNARPHEKHTTLHARRKRLKKTLGKSACTQYVRRVGVAAAC